MSIEAAQKLIQSLVRSESLHAERDNRGQRPPPTVTISRELGSGACEVATRLAKRLGVEVWDSEILKGVAEAARVSPELMAELDERVRHKKDAWVYNLLSGQNAYVSTYRHHLFNVILGLAAQGGVIMGRGAHLILANRPVFRLRITSPAHLCARRYAQRSGLGYNEALEEVKRVNQERETFLRDDFGHSNNEAGTFDMVLNTERFDGRWDQLADLTVAAMASAGLRIR